MTHLFYEFMPFFGGAGAEVAQNVALHQEHTKKENESARKRHVAKKNNERIPDMHAQQRVAEQAPTLNANASSTSCFVSGPYLKAGIMQPNVMKFVEDSEASDRFGTLRDKANESGSSSEQEAAAKQVTSMLRMAAIQEALLRSEKLIEKVGGFLCFNY